MRSYRSSLCIFAGVLTAPAFLAADNASPTSRTNEWRSSISVPIHYDDIAVILADEKGVAAITFRCPSKMKRKPLATSDVVEYRYRYYSTDGTETSGQGLLYEKYKRDQNDESLVVDVGGRLNVRTGHFQLEWSQGDAEQGWL